MSALDSTLNFLKRQFTTASGAFDSITELWTNKVNELKAKAHDFTEIYNRVFVEGEKLQKDSALYSDFKRIMNSAANSRAFIEAVTKKVDAASTGTRALGRGGLMSGMDAIPLIAPVSLAIITGGITLLAMNISEMLAIERRIKLAIAAGADPDKLLDSAREPTLTESIFGKGALLSPLLIVSAVALGYIFWPEIKKRVFK